MHTLIHHLKCSPLSLPTTLRAQCKCHLLLEALQDAPSQFRTNSLRIGQSQPYSKPTTLVFIYFLFPRLCGEFFESTDILKGKRGQWSRGGVLEPDTLGTNPSSIYPFTHSWVKLHHLWVPPLSHMHHGIRMGLSSKGREDEMA